MKKIQIAESSGIQARGYDGKIYRIIGNKTFQPGDWVWTDGRCIYGNVSVSQSPAVFWRDEEEEEISQVIPILTYENLWNSPDYINEWIEQNEVSREEIKENYASSSSYGRGRVFSWDMTENTLVELTTTGSFSTRRLSNDENEAFFSANSWVNYSSSDSWHERPIAIYHQSASESADGLAHVFSIHWLRKFNSSNGYHELNDNTFLICKDGEVLKTASDGSEFQSMNASTRSESRSARTGMGGIVYQDGENWRAWYAGYWGYDLCWHQFGHWIVNSNTFNDDESAPSISTSAQVIWAFIEDENNWGVITHIKASADMAVHVKPTESSACIRYPAADAGSYYRSDFIDGDGDANIHNGKSVYLHPGGTRVLGTTSMHNVYYDQARSEPTTVTGLDGVSNSFSVRPSSGPAYERVPIDISGSADFSGYHGLRLPMHEGFYYIINSVSGTYSDALNWPRFENITVYDASNKQIFTGTVPFDSTICCYEIQTDLFLLGIDGHALSAGAPNKWIASTTSLPTATSENFSGDNADPADGYPDFVTNPGLYLLDLADVASPATKETAECLCTGDIRQYFFKPLNDGENWHSARLNSFSEDIYKEKEEEQGGQEEE